MRALTGSLILLLVIIFSACDTIEDPYDGSSGPVTGGVNGIPRKVLVEDFTGFRCVNCPLASEAADNLQTNVYGDQMIIVGVHMIDFFTQPEADPDHPGYFLTDFRTQAGADYESEFGVFGIPIGVVNRTEENDNILIGFGAWDGKIGDLLMQPADVDIKIKHSEYISSSGEIDIEIDAIVDNNLNGDFKITLYLVEDSILEGQYDGSEVVEDFLHRHVLRGALNGSWGESIFSSPSAGDSIHFEGSFALPSSISSTPASNPDIDISKCEVVAYIYKSGIDEYEIIQVEKAHVEVQ